MELMGRKSFCIPWLPVLPSQRVIRRRLVLSQIPILWKIKCPGERKKMDSHLDGLWSFYLNFIFATLLEWSMEFLFLLFIIFHYLEKMTPYSFAGITLNFFGVFWMARPFGMNGHTVKILGLLLRGNFVGRRLMSIPRVGD